MFPLVRVRTLCVGCSAFRAYNNIILAAHASKLAVLLVFVVELRGFEPLASSMPWKRATNCAIAPSDVGVPVGTRKILAHRPRGCTSPRTPPSLRRRRGSPHAEALRRNVEHRQPKVLAGHVHHRHVAVTERRQ